jgi:hypothetical protein
MGRGIAGEGPEETAKWEHFLRIVPPGGLIRGAAGGKPVRDKLRETQ